MRGFTRAAAIGACWRGELAEVPQMTGNRADSALEGVCWASRWEPFNRQ